MIIKNGMKAMYEKNSVNRMKKKHAGKYKYE